MPKPKLKSPELLQSQVASFASEKLTRPEDIKHVFANMGASALQAGNDSPTLYRDYVDHLRKTREDGKEMRDARTELLQSYSHFEDSVDTLMEGFEPNDAMSRRLHPHFLGSGFLSDGFMITKDGKRYVVRIPRSIGEDYMPSGTDPDPYNIDKYLITGIHGKGIPHLEQFVAASYEKGVSVSELMPGIASDELSASDRSHITDEQLQTLASTILVAKRAGILTETENPGNLFYDREAGFGFIDYGSVDQPMHKEYGWKQTPEDVTHSIIKSLTMSATSTSPEEQAQLRDLSSRIKNIFTNTLSEEAWGESSHFPNR